MEKLQSVAKDAVPASAAPPAGMGVWTGLARQAVADHEQGQVTVVKLADDAEYKRLRNNCADAIRSAGYLLRPVITRETDGLIVYLKLETKPKERLRRPAQSGIRPAAGNVRIRKIESA